MANTTNLNLTSILLEKGSNNGNGNRILNTNKQNGIDFANDTVITTAQNDVDYAKGVEATKNSEKSFGEMALAHINQTYGNQLSQYETALSLYSIAKSATESLSSTQSSVLDELSATNNQVANLTQNQAASNNALTTLRNEKTSLNDQKASAVAVCNNNISQTKGEISNLRGRKSNVEGQISSKRSKLNSMPDSYQVVEENADGTKTTRTISNVAEKNRLRNEISRLESERDQLENNINAKNTLLEQQEATKVETINQYDNQISAKQKEIDAECVNLDEITYQLAEETLKQASLTQQADAIAAMMKEAQTFEKSVTEMMATAYTAMEKTEEDRLEAEENLEVQEAELEEAQNTSKTKETVLSKAEEETLSKYEKEFSSENGFIF